MNFLLNSLWLSMLYGNAFTAVIAARTVKELVMFPINTMLLVLVLRAVTAVRLTGGEQRAR